MKNYDWVVDVVCLLFLAVILFLMVDFTRVIGIFK